MRRPIAAILLVAILAIGGGLIATTAYQAGLSTAVTTAVAGGGTVVAPVPAYAVGYGYGYAWHPFGFGLGFFGFLGTLLFLFLVFGLIRAVLFRGGHGHGQGRGGNFWESRFGESFEEWHRQAHGPESSSEPPTSNTGSKPA